jgi:hypothetical protein
VAAALRRSGRTDDSFAVTLPTDRLFMTREQYGWWACALLATLSLVALLGNSTLVFGIYPLWDFAWFSAILLICGHVAGVLVRVASLFLQASLPPFYSMLFRGGWQRPAQLVLVLVASHDLWFILEPFETGDVRPQTVEAILAIFNVALHSFIAKVFLVKMLETSGSSLSASQFREAHFWDRALSNLSTAPSLSPSPSSPTVAGMSVELHDIESPIAATPQQQGSVAAGSNIGINFGGDGGGANANANCSGARYRPNGIGGGRGGSDDSSETEYDPMLHQEEGGWSGAGGAGGSCPKRRCDGGGDHNGAGACLHSRQFWLSAAGQQSVDKMACRILGQGRGHLTKQDFESRLHPAQAELAWAFFLSRQEQCHGSGAGNGSTRLCGDGLKSGLNELYLTLRQFIQAEATRSNHATALDTLGNIMWFVGIDIWIIAFYGVNLIDQFAAPLAGLLVVFGFGFGPILATLVQSTILVFVKRPFQVGDFIKVDGGSDWYQVESIRLWDTHFYKLEGEAVYISNKVLFEATITNLQRSSECWIDMFFQVLYVALSP